MQIIPLHLKRRRPDLWRLQLTPENTNTLIPYLTIVNEVLETYLDQAGHADIYGTLSDPSVKVSFRVPFSLPFAELGLYLGHFGVTPADIYRTLGLPAAQVHRAQLGLAPAEAAVITSPDPGGVLARLGHPGELGDHHVQDFLRVTGLERSQLDALLASRFHPDLGAVTVTSRGGPRRAAEPPADSRQPHARTPGLHAPLHPAVALHVVADHRARPHPGRRAGGQAHRPRSR